MMKRFIRRRFVTGFRRGQRGFTLIELLIVIVILGIIAGIVIPSVGAFRRSGTLNAANSEVQNVKTAATGYLAENDEWPGNSTAVRDYLDKAPKAVYTFDKDTGRITDADPSNGGVTPNWGSDIEWDDVNEKWVKATP